jgi:hypothetical protein
MRTSIPLDLSSRSFIPLPCFMCPRRVASLLVPSLVFSPRRSAEEKTNPTESTPKASAPVSVHIRGRLCLFLVLLIRACIFLWPAAHILDRAAMLPPSESVLLSGTESPKKKSNPLFFLIFTRFVLFARTTGPISGFWKKRETVVGHPNGNRNRTT